MVKRGICGTFGCTRPDKHGGLHRLPAIGKRRNAVTVETDTIDNKIDETDDKYYWKRATIPELCTFQCADERNDILIEDPCSDFIATGRMSPPPSPYPMRELLCESTERLSESSETSEALEMSRTASPTPSDLEMMLGIRLHPQSSSQSSPRPSLWPLPPPSILQRVAEALWPRVDTPPCVITYHTR